MMSDGLFMRAQAFGEFWASSPPHLYRASGSPKRRSFTTPPRPPRPKSPGKDTLETVLQCIPYSDTEAPSSLFQTQHRGAGIGLELLETALASEREAKRALEDENARLQVT